MSATRTTWRPGMAGRAGERNPRARLTLEQVQWIRTNPEKLTAQAAADRLGVSRTHVALIRAGKRWPTDG